MCNVNYIVDIPEILPDHIEIFSFPSWSKCFVLFRLLQKLKICFKTKQNKIRKSNLSTLRMPENPFLLDLYVYLEQMNYSKRQTYESLVVTNATIFLNPLNSKYLCILHITYSVLQLVWFFNYEEYSFSINYL